MKNKTTYYTVVLYPDDPDRSRPIIVFAEDHERVLVILHNNYPGVPFSNFIEMEAEGAIELVP